MRPPRTRAGRGDGAAALALVPSAPPLDRAAPRPSGYLALDAVRAALDGVEWAPLRLAAGRAVRPASPRLPHALALHLAHAARAAAGGAESPGAVLPDRPRLAALLAADAAQVDGALDALRRAGVVVDGGPPGWVRLASSVVGEPPRCAALDWAAVAAATAGSPTAWVAAHALAEWLERHHWTPVPRAALEHTLGVGASGARGALDRLAAAGVVERREQRGGVSVYRFAGGAWEGAGSDAGPAAVRAAGPVPARPAVPVGPAPGGTAPGPAASAGAAPGLRMVLGGVEVEVPAGLRARVEVGPDGRPTLTLLPGS